MSLDIWHREDIRNVILAANAVGAGAQVEDNDGTPDSEDRQATYRAGYEAALVALATAFGIPLVANGRLRSPGVVIPGARLSVSYRAEMTLARLLQSREEVRP